MLTAEDALPAIGAVLANPHRDLARLARAHAERKDQLPPRHSEPSEWRRWWQALPHGELEAETTATALMVGASSDGGEKARSAALKWCVDLLKRELDSQTRAQLPRLRELVSRSHRVQDGLNALVGNSREIRKVRKAAWRAAFGRRLSLSHAQLLHASPVLISGETGTGKEGVAQAICEAAPQSASVHLAATREELVNDELFGHEPGAFTGALKKRIGVLERLHGGAVFLDEVGELPASTQVALLRCLQEGKVRRLGGDEPVEASPRVLAATNQDLPRLVERGRFREDLYYRLCCLEIEVPPLRQRRGDLHLLAQNCLQELGLLDEFGPMVERKLAAFVEGPHKDYPWPGNVRELRTFVQRIAVGVVTLPSSVKQRTEVLPEELLDARWSHVEARGWYARHALEQHGTRTETAKRLGVTRVTLNKYLQEAP